jgi:hypothetical protein
MREKGKTEVMRGSMRIVEKNVTAKRRKRRNKREINSGVSS